MNNLNIDTYENKLNILNIKIIEFLDLLNIIIRNDNIIKCKNKIKLALLYDVNIIYDLCEKHITDYKHDILNKNDKVLIDIEKNILNNEIKLYNTWNTIEEDNKIIIWKYLNIFLLLVS
jgi:hypothetical protein|tara:strand:+ start:90 stop:446 length:357 start_codon:yes stop_codon:yes gene_type:complete